MYLYLLTGFFYLMSKNMFPRKHGRLWFILIILLILLVIIIITQWLIIDCVDIPMIDQQSIMFKHESTH